MIAARGRVGLVVVDPQRAFTEVDGMLGRLKGADEFRVIRDTVGRLAAFVAAHEGPKVWLRALYEPGQFTRGDLDDPMSGLCADPESPDWAWDGRLVPPAGARVITKHEMDGSTSAEFVEATDSMIGSVDAL